MKKLNVDLINESLEELSLANFKTIELIGKHTVDSNFANKISTILGCSGNHSVDCNAGPGGEVVGGSNLFALLMYQNLLLAKRVSEIEGLFKHVQTVVFSSESEKRVFVERYMEPIVYPGESDCTKESPSEKTGIPLDGNCGYQPTCKKSDKHAVPPGDE